MKTPLSELLTDALGDVTIARATLQDSIETHGTHGGWLDEECKRLGKAEDTLRAALDSPPAPEQEAPPDSIRVRLRLALLALPRTDGGLHIGLQAALGAIDKVLSEQS